MKELTQHEERLLHIQDMYDTWTMAKYNEGISYGEIHHIETLPMHSLDELEKELVEELDKLNLL